MFCGCGRKKKKKAKGGKETIGEDDLPVPLVPSNVKDCKSADVKSAKTLLKPALKVSFSKDEISDVIVEGQEDLSVRDALLLWCRRTVEGYPSVHIKDFSSSWRDGKAFLSIIHRHRPDLVDFRKVRGQTARQNLEMAFNIAENEFGVTKLLDPEDVDVPRPDEKSLITYVSSLYDVFPQVPSVEQSLRDNERQLKWDEYRDLASKLLHWLQDSTVLMLDRNFPTTLIEMKSLLAEFNRFRIEDIPPRLVDKQKLGYWYKELHQLHADAGPFSLESELHIDNINRQWDRLVLAQQEKDLAIQAELSRLERLQRLAEKVHRDAKAGEEHLDDIDRRIKENEQRLEHIPVMEARRSCDEISHALKLVESSIRSMFSDVQALKDGRYHQAEQMYKRVYRIHQRWSNLQASLQNELLPHLASRTYAEEVATVTQHTETVTEYTLKQAQDAFRRVHTATEWVQNKQIELENTGYGNDLDSTRDALEFHKVIHQEVLDFQSELGLCVSVMDTLSGREASAYREALSRLELAYSQLKHTSSRRQHSLETLLEFMDSATRELLWLSQKEETEISRDWSSKSLQLREIQEYHERLIQELDNREAQFVAVVDKGEALVMDRHPASKTIEAYMNALQGQWAWLLQLTMCLQSHLEQASQYYKFFEEASQVDEWLSKQSEALNTYYNRHQLTPEEGEKLIREIQDMYGMLTEYEHIIESLLQRSHQVSPLKKRAQFHTSPIRLQALCSYKQLTMSISRGEECVLLDNSMKTKWQVRNSTGQEGIVPAVCFVIPPPNQEAVQFAEELQQKLKRLRLMWREKQKALKRQMILATIRMVKGWDLAKFQSMGAGQRDAIMQALNDDTQKLLTECGPDRELENEMRDCNQHYISLNARQTEEVRSPSKDLVDRLDALSANLDQMDRLLTTRLQAALPQTLGETVELFASHRDFEERLQRYEPEVATIQQQYQRLSPSRRTPQVESKLTIVVEKWEQMTSFAHLYRDRLSAAEVLLRGLKELEEVISENECTLVSQTILSNDSNQLLNTRNQLENIQSSLQTHQIRVDDLERDMMTVKQIVVRSRPGLARTHPDVQRLEKDVDNLTNRWEGLCVQTSDRLKNLEVAESLLEDYKISYTSEEMWLDSKERQVKSLPQIPTTARQAQPLIELAVKLYDELKSHRYQIEDINRTGGKFIKEAKIYERRLKQFQESLADLQPDFAASLQKRARVQSGADTVQTDLNDMNKQYMEMLSVVNHYLKRLKTLHDKEGLYFPHKVDDTLIRIRTYRSELRMVEDDDDFDTWLSVSGQTSTSPVRAETTIRTVKLSQQQAEETMDTNMSMPSLQPITVSSIPKKPDQAQSIANVTSISVMSRGRHVIDVSDNIPERKHVQSVIHVKSDSFIPKGQVLHVSAIINPQTGKAIPLTEAIQTGIFDEESGHFVDPATGKKLSLSEALRLGIIDQNYFRELQQKCGIRDPRTGLELSLLQAIQKSLFSPRTGQMKDPKTGKFINIDEAVNKGLLSPDSATRLSYISIATEGRSHSEAFYGLSDLKDYYPQLSLHDAVVKGLYNSQAGCFIDPISKESLSLTEAIHRQLINPNSGGITHPVTGEKLIVSEAIYQGIINANNGKFVDPRNKRQMSLIDAIQKQFIQKPKSLSDALLDGSLDSKSWYKDPVTCKKLTLLEAIEKGILDTEIKCILDPRTDEILSLSEAMKRGLINAEGKFIHPTTGQEFAIQDAVNRGLAQLVTEDVDFPETGISDTITGETLTLSEALQRGYIDPARHCYTDKRTGEEMSLNDATRKGFIHSSLLEQLYQPSGLKTASGMDINILDAIKDGLLDTRTGTIVDPVTGNSLSIHDAVSQGHMESKKARQLMKLTSSLVKTTTVTTDIQMTRDGTGKGRSMTVAVRHPSPTKPEQHSHLEETEEHTQPIEGGEEKFKRYQRQDVVTRRTEHGFETVAIHEAKVMQMSSTKHTDISGDFELPLSVVDATKFGLLNAESGIFLDPVTSEKMSLQEAFQKDFLRSESAMFNYRERNEMMTLQHAMQKKLVDSVGHYFDKKTKTTLTLQDMIRQGIVTTSTVPVLPGSGKSRVILEDRRILVRSAIDTQTGKEVDVDEARRRGILDTERGFYKNLVTGEKMTLQQAAEAGLLKADSQLKALGDYVTTKTIKESKSYTITGAIDPNTGKKIEIGDALQKGIIDQTNKVYNGKDRQGKPFQISISEAIKQGLVIAELCTSKTDVLDSEPRYLQETKTFSIKGVIDPVKHVEIPVSEAIQRGLLDQAQGHYINPGTGETMLITEAVSKGLIIADVTVTTSVSNVPPSSTLVMSRKVDYTLQSITDPLTGKQISVSEAMERGVLNQEKGEYKNLRTGQVLSLDEAISKNLIKVQVGKPEPRKEKPIERVPSVHIDDELDAMEDMSVEEVTEERKTFQISGVMDPVREETIPLIEAIDEGLINEEKGLYCNPQTGETIPIPEAISQGFIVGELISKTAEVEVFKSSWVASRKDGGDVTVTSALNPITGLRIPVTQAIHMGLLDRELKYYYNPATDERLGMEEAIEKGYINPTEDDLAKYRPRVRLPDYNHEEFHPAAKAKAVIDWESCSVRDSNTGQRISHEQAVSSGLIDQTTADLLSLKAETMPFRGLTKSHETTEVKTTTEKEGVIQISRTGERRQVALDAEESDKVILTLTTTDFVNKPKKSIVVEESIDTSSVITESSATVEEIPVRGMLSFQAAVKLGLYDVKSGQFRDPTTGQIMSLCEATEQGLLDMREPAIIDLKSGRYFSLEESLSSGLINDQGKINERKAYSLHITLDPQFTFKEHKQSPLNMEDAVLCGLLNPDTGTVMNPTSGAICTLGEAITKGIISGTSVLVVDPNSGEAMSLENAVQIGVVDGKTGKIMNIKTKKPMMSLTEAIKAGLIESVFKPDTVSVVQKEDGTHIPVSQAVHEGTIDQSSASVYDPKSKRRISIDEAVRSGIIDKNQQTYKDIITGEKISLEEAAKKGLLMLVGAPVLAGMGIAQAIKKVTRTDSEMAAGLSKSAVMKERIIEDLSGRGMSAVTGRPSDLLDSIQPQAGEVKETEMTTEKTPLKVKVSDREVSVSQKVILKSETKRGKEIVRDTTQAIGTVESFGDVKPSGIATIEYHPPEETREHLQFEMKKAVESQDKRQVDVQDSRKTTKVRSEVTVTSKVDRDEVKAPKKPPREVVHVTTTTTTKTMKKSKDLPETASGTIEQTKPGTTISEQMAIGERRGGDLVDIDWEKGIITNEHTREKMSPDEAIKQGLIDTHIAHLIETRMEQVRSTHLTDDVSGVHHPGKPAQVISDVTTMPSSEPGGVGIEMQQSRQLIEVSSTKVELVKKSQDPFAPPGVDLTSQGTKSNLVDADTGRQITVGEAIDRGLIDIDWEKGIVTNTYTNEKMSPTEALKQGLIDTHIAHLIETRLEQLKSLPAGKISLNEAATTGLLIVPLGRIKNPATNTRMTIEEAIDVNFIDPDISVIIDPATGRHLTLTEAIQSGLLNPHTGDCKNTATGKVMTLTEMSLEGLIPEEGIRRTHTLTLHSAIEQGFVEPKTGTFTHPVTGEVMEVEKALNLGYLITMEGDDYTVTSDVVASRISSRSEPSRFETTHEVPTPRVRDTRNAVPLDRAIYTGLVHADTGQYTDPVTGEVMSLAQAITFGLIKGPERKLSPDEDIEGINFDEAVERNLIDIKGNTFTEPVTEVLMPLDAAIRKGYVLLPEGGVKVRVTETKDDTLTRHQVSIKTGIIVEGSQMTQIDEQRTARAILPPVAEPLNFTEAVEKGLIDLQAGTFSDPLTGNVISVADAIRQNLINAADEPTVLEGVTLTLTEAINKGSFNEKTGVFTDPKTGSQLSLKAAINSGLIDKDSLIYDTTSKEPITVQQAMARGIIHEITGHFIDSQTQRTMSIKDATKLGLLAVVGAPVLAGKAIVEAVHRSISPSAMEFKTDTLTSKESTSDRQDQDILVLRITEENISKIPSDTGLTMRDAISQEKLNPTTGKVFHAKSERSYTLAEAIKTGIILPNSADVIFPDGSQKPLWNAIQDGTMDSYGRLLDPSSGAPLTLEAALRKGYVQDNLNIISWHKIKITKITETVKLAVSGVFDSEQGHDVSLKDAKLRGIIDEVAGTYRDTRQGTVMDVSSAFDNKLIKGQVIDTSQKKEEFIKGGSTAEMPATSLSVIQSVIDPETERPISPEEARAKGILNESAGYYMDPRTKETMPLEDAVEAGLINMRVTSAVVETTHQADLEERQSWSVNITGVIDARTGQVLSLSEASKQGILSKESGKYMHPVSGEVMPLEEAVQKGLVVTEDQELPSAEHHTFTVSAVHDPISGDLLTPDEAVRRGVLDMDKETYIDPSTGKQMPLTEAMENGFIKTTSVSKTLETVTATQKHTIDTHHEQQTFCIKSVTDPLTGERLHPAEAEDRGILDLTKGIYVNIETGESVAIHEAFTAGYIQAVESSEQAPGELSATITAALESKSYTIVAALDTRTNEQINISEAFKRGIINHDMCQYVDLQTGDVCSIKEAIDKGLIIADEGTTTPEPSVVIHETRSYTIKSVIDPRTGEEIPIADAIRHKIVDKSKWQYWNMQTDKHMSIDDAIKEGLIIAEPLGSSLSKEAVIELDSMPTTKLYALKTVKDPNTGEEYDHVEAERRGLINKVQGIYMDPITGDKISIREAIRLGYITAIEVEQTEDYQEQYKDEMIYATLETVRESQTMNISSVIDLQNVEEISVIEAIERGIIDPKKGIYRNLLSGETMTFSEAYEKKLVKAHMKEKDSILVTQAPRITKTFNVTAVRDSNTGVALNLNEAINKGLLDMERSEYCDPHTGERMPFHQAASQGLLLVEGDTKKFSSNELESMHYKVETRDTYLSDGKDVKRSAPVVEPMSKDSTLQKSTEGSLSRSSAVLDTTLDTSYPWTVGSETMDDMSKEVTNFDISRDEFDVSTPYMKYSEALEQGLVDVEHKEYTDPFTKEIMPLEQALKNKRLFADVPVLLEKHDVHEVVTRKTEQTTVIDIMNLEPDKESRKPHEPDKKSDLNVTRQQPEEYKIQMETKHKKHEAHTVPEKCSVKPDKKKTVMQTTPETERPLPVKKDEDYEKLKQSISDLPTKTKENGFKHSPETDGYNLADKPAVNGKPETVYKSSNLIEEMHIDSEEITQTKILSQKKPSVKKDVSNGHVELVETLKTETIHHSYKIETGYVFTNEGLVKNTLTAVTIPVKEALEKGILEEVRSDVSESDVSSLSYPAAVFDQVDKGDKILMVRDASSGDLLDTAQCVQRGLFTADGRIVDPVTKTVYTVAEALQKRLAVLVSTDGVSEEDELMAPDTDQSHGPMENTSQITARETRTVTVTTQEVSGTIQKKEPAQPTEKPTEVKEAVHMERIITVKDVSVTEKKDREQVETMLDRALREADEMRQMDRSVHDSLEPDASQQFDSESSLPTQMSVKEAIQAGVIDPGTGRITDLTSGKAISFETAISTGILDTTATVVVLPGGSETMTMDEALRKGCIDIKTGDFIDPRSGRMMSLSTAAHVGIIQDATHLPSIDELYEHGLYNYKTGMVTDKQTGEEMPLLDAVEHKLVDKNTVVVSHPVTGKSLSLSEAFEKGVLDAETGLIIDSERKTKRNLKDSIKLGVLGIAAAPIVGVVKLGNVITDALSGKEKSAVIPTPSSETKKKSEGIPFSTAVKEKLYDVHSNTVKDPKTGKEVTLPEAVQRGLVDLGNTVLHDPMSGVRNTIEEMVKQRNVDLKSGTVTLSTGETISLEDAISSGLMTDIREGPMSLIQLFEEQLYNPDTGEFLDPVTEDIISMNEALERGLLDPLSVVVNDRGSGEVIGLNEAIEENLIDVETSYVKDTSCRENVPLTEAVDRGILITRPMPVIRAVEVGLYNETTGKFLDPTCRRFFSLEEAVSNGLVDSESTILDPATGKHMTISKAFECGMMDPRHGSVHNLHTGETISLKDAVMASKIMKSREVMTLEEAMNNNCYDVERNIIFNPVSKEEMTLEEALDTGLISRNSAINDPATGEKITLAEAIQRDIIDLDSGQVFNTKTGTAIPLTVAMREEALDLGDAITKGLYEQDNNTVVDPKTNEEITLRDAIEKGVIRTDSLLDDPATGQKITLDEAVSQGLLDLSTGLLFNSQTGEALPISDQFIKGKSLKIRVDSLPMLTLDQAIRDGLYNEENTTIINPLTREEMKLDEAIEKGVLDAMSRVKEPNTGEMLTLEDAIESGVIDTNMGIVIDTQTGESFTFTDAFTKGLITITEQRHEPMSVTEVIRQGLLDDGTGTIQDPVSGKELTFEDAVKSNIMSISNLRIMDKTTGTLLTFREASEKNLLDPRTGNVWDPDAKKEVPLSVAVNKGLALEFAKPPMSPREALVQGLLESSTGRIVDPKSGRKVGLTEAVVRGLIDPDSFKVKDPKSGKLIHMEEALKRGIMDADTGTMKDPETGRELSLHDALKKGFVIESKAIKKRSLVDAIRSGLYDPEHGTINDPSSSADMTVLEAINTGLVDTHNVKVGVPGTTEVVSIETALNENIIDPLSGVLLNPSTGECIDLLEAEQAGMIFVSDTEEQLKQPDLKQMVGGGLCDKESGTIQDPDTGKNMTIIEAMQTGLIDSSAPLLAINNEALSLEEAVKQGYVDPLSGEITDPVTGQLESLFSYVERNEVPSLPQDQHALNDLLDDSCIDVTDNTVRNPVTGRKMSFLEAVRSGTIDAKQIIVITPESGAQMTMSEAADQGLINLSRGTLVDREKNREVPLSQAITAGLIADVPQSLTLDEAVRNGSYNPETGLFVDPHSSSPVSFNEALSTGLIDVSDTLVKNPESGQLISFRDAIKTGLVDGKTGRLKSINRWIGLNEATEGNFIFSISSHKPSLKEFADGCLLHQSGYILDPFTKKKVTLQEAVQDSLIDIDSSIIVDPTTGKKMSVEQAVQDGILDPESGKLIDHHTGKKISLKDAARKEMLFEAEKQKPLTLQYIIESGAFNEDTGKIIHPQTGKSITLDEAVKSGVIDGESLKVKHPDSDTLLTFEEAVKAGMLDPNTGDILSPEGEVLTLSEAIHGGLAITATTAEGLSIHDAVQQGLYNSETGKLTHPFTGKEMYLKDALESGIIDGSKSALKDLQSGDVITLEEAIESRLIDLVKGTIDDPATGQHFSLGEAIIKNILVENKEPGFSLAEAREHGLFDPTSGKITHPKTGQQLTLGEALDQGIIDPQLTQFKDPKTKTLVPMDTAISIGILNEVTGQIRDPVTGKEITYIEALEDGLATDASLPPMLSLHDIIENDLHDPEHDLIRDPVTKQPISFQEAVERGIIDPSKSFVSLPCIAGQVTLADAIEQGLVDATTGSLFNPETKEHITIVEAMRQGILTDASESGAFGLTLEEAIEEGIFSPNEGRITDPQTGKKMTLREAVSDGLIDADRTFVTVPGTNEQLPLGDALERGLIDERTGTLKDKATEEMVSSVPILVHEHDLHELKTDIELYACTIIEALERGILNGVHGYVKVPGNGKAVKFCEAVDSGLILTGSMYILDTETGKYLTYEEAVSVGYLNPNNAQVYEQSSHQYIPVGLAVERGYISCIKKPLTVKDILLQNICDDDTGLFIHPVNGQVVDFTQLITDGIINPDLILMNYDEERACTLTSFIQQGKFDLHTGMILGVKGSSMTFKNALITEILYDSTKSGLSLKKAALSGLLHLENNLIEEPGTNNQTTLLDAIMSQNIDPEQTLVLDTETDQLISLSVAIQKGIIDPIEAQIKEPKTRQKTSLFRAILQGLNLLSSNNKETKQETTREGEKPLSIDEAESRGLFNKQSGQVTDPLTGTTMSLEAAISAGVIEGESIRVKVPGSRDMVSLKEAIERGIVDGESGMILDEKSGKHEMDVRERCKRAN
ncbi:hypothetical protein LSH36_68g10066 [Paralvinella palmiformis]|uniref:Uncharacterized protein n=1 Tax=Paralvinella palmiformis TaxID=53620 RepID=A0AAD9NBG9_9ANNE|nr:hypothetical protein LSH36_68g10066 [Paralvinella palmiformis]